MDLAANAESLGAYVIRAGGITEFREALGKAKQIDRTVVIHIETDRYQGVPSYESWWDVPVAEVSGMPSVGTAREEYDSARRAQRRYL